MTVYGGDLLSDTNGDLYTVVAVGREHVIVWCHTDQRELAWHLSHVEKWERLS